KITFYVRNRVCVEFVGHGIDEEKGYEYCHIFSSLDEAINSIEGYLETPIADWVNYTKTGLYPELPAGSDIEVGTLNLMRDIISKRIKIPSKGEFRLWSDIPWKTFEEYQAWRADHGIDSKISSIDE